MEVIIYISIIAVIFMLVISTVLSFTGSYHKLTALRNVENSAVDALERMTRELRDATDVNAAESVLGTSPGVLTLTKTYEGISTTTKFYVGDEILKIDVNGSYVGPLSGAGVRVTSLVFNLITTPRSQAVKVGITLNGTDGQTSVVKTYYSTIMLTGL